MKKGIIYIVLASVLWGTSGLFSNCLAQYGMGSFQMTFIRASVAFVCMAAYVLITDRRVIKTNPKEIPLFIGSGISFFFTGTCYFYCMQLTSVSTAVVLMYTAPIFVMVYSTTFLNEKLNGTKLISVAGMIAGCALVSGIIGGFKFDLIGVAVGLLSGIAYASYNIITKVEMQKGINPVKANLYCFLFSMFAGLLATNPVDIIGCVRINPAVVISLAIAMGILTSILPYFFYTLALRAIPAGTASSLAILEPMAATILSVLVLGETLSLYSLIGIILILTSVFLLSRHGE